MTISGCYMLIAIFVRVPCFALFAIMGSACGVGHVSAIIRCGHDALVDVLDHGV